MRHVSRPAAAGEYAGHAARAGLYLARNKRSGDSVERGMGEADRPAVLVVDDEPAVRLLVTEVLADEGCEILQAETSEAGLAWLQSDRTIDLLVTDIGLPGMNGRQLADAGLLHRPGLRILFITGNAEQALLDKACLAPSMHVLSKPFAIDRLAARVRAILAAAPERG